MSLGTVSGTPQHVFLSTHNALRLGEDGESDRLAITVSELQPVGQQRGGGHSNCGLSVFPFYDIEMVKRQVIKRLELPRSTNVSEIRIFYRGNELPNHRSLLACATDRERRRIKLQWAFRDGYGVSAVGVRELGIRPPPGLESTISEINLALQRGINPKLTMDGTGGTYILSNTNRQSVAIFKPSDEEAFAPNNPRGYEGKLGQKGFRSGVLSGEGAQREVAAFLLDAQYGRLTGIPETTKVEAAHPIFSYRAQKNVKTWKDGSLQEFVGSLECCGDFDAKAFSISDAHHIGIFDLRILNLDRNDGNLLVGPAHHLRNQYHTDTTTSPTVVDKYDLTPDGKLSKYRLVPIDHGLILPDTMDLGDIDLVWYRWPQSKIEFSESELRHIFSLDPDRDALRLARKLEIREECLRTMRVSTRVLQIGACMHLNLFQIATLLLRFGDFEEPSIMERAVKTSLMQACTAVNATSLIHQNRLPGSVLIDLQIGERRNGALQLPRYDEPSDSIDDGTPATRNPNSSSTRKVDFAVSSPPSSPHLSQADLQQQHPDLSSASKSLLLFNSNDPILSYTLPKLNTLHQENDDGLYGHAKDVESWSSSVSSRTRSSTSSSASMEEGAASGDGSPVLVSRISGVPLCNGSEGNRLGRRQKRQAKTAERSSPHQKASSAHHTRMVDSNSDERTSATSCIVLDEVLLEHPNGTERPSKNDRHIPLAQVDNLVTSRTFLHKDGSLELNQHAWLKKIATFNSHVEPFHQRTPATTSTTTTTTVRKRSTALSNRRGTGTRKTPANMNSTWVLIDNNRKPVPLDWENPLLEKTFFECFGLLIRRHIMESYPDWESLPFNGYNLFKEGQTACATGSQRKQRRSTAKRFDDASSTSSAVVYG